MDMSVRVIGKTRVRIPLGSMSDSARSSGLAILRGIAEEHYPAT